MKLKFAVLVIAFCSVPCWATTYYMAVTTASPAGSDANSGIDAAHPWATPNHALNCGDVIFAGPGTYPQGMTFGTVTCAAGNSVAWLKCATFDTCKVVTTGSAAYTHGIIIDKSYWGVQGWEVTALAGGSGACFSIRPAGAANIHHVIIADNIANQCSNGGIAVNSNAGNSTGVDYFVALGNIVYNAAQTSTGCTSGINSWQPHATDSLQGTHYYYAGNFSFDNVDPNPCNGTLPTDGEGLFFDTPQTPGYAQQMVMDNNIAAFNGGGGVQIIKNSTGSPNASIYLRHNTTYGNQTGTINTTSGCAEILGYLSYSTEVSYNLSVAGATTCYGSAPAYVLAVMQPNSTTLFDNNWGYSAAANNTLGSGTGFTWGPNNTFSNPSLANPVNPGAPSCSGKISTVDCMSTVIANFTPTNGAAAGYGYQVPSTTSRYDALYPQWLCGISNLPAGLQTPGCGQAWNGVLSSNRAIDWTQAGIPGGLPDGSWTQCGSTIAAYGTSGTPGSTAAINSQIAGCSANQYVQLGAGTFYLSGAIVLKNQTVVRGMGANATTILFYDMGSCGGLYSQFCEAGSVNYIGGEENHATWTAGFAQGATSITLSNSLNITAGQTTITLDQQDEATDTGNIWNCLGAACGGFTGGFARTDDTCSSAVSPNVGYCSQQQSVLVTGCSPSCNNAGSTVLTISPGLYMNNWRSSQSTGAWWATTTAYRMGVEDLSADLTNTHVGTSTVVMFNCYQCWTSGIRSIMAARNHIYVYGCDQCQVQFNYLYQSTAHATVSYAIELTSGTSNSLILSNICQQITDSCPSNTSGGAGNVAAYNLALDDVYASDNWMQPSDYEHASGEDFWLREGQSSIGLIADNVHGTHFFTTMFRNYLRGWQGDNLCNGAPCTVETDAMQLYAASRYFNIVGNVLGQAGFHTHYACDPSATSCSYGALSMYVLGYTNNSGIVNPAITGFCTNPPTCNTFGDYDPLTGTSLMRWGNYDTVNAATRFVSGEVPSAFGDTTGSPSIYANAVPASNALPNSLIFSSTAATTAAVPCGSGVGFNRNPTRGTCEPFPYYGPDVSSGDLGNCASGTYAGAVCRVGSNQCGGSIACTQAMGGYANLNPAHSCFLDVMGGVPDGTGSVLTYNRASCYANDPLGSPGAGGAHYSGAVVMSGHVILQVQ